MAQFPLDLCKLADLVHGDVIGSGPSIRRVVIDSRLRFRSGDLFVALQGPRFDGGDFGEDAWRKGASTVLISRAHPLAQKAPPEGKSLIVVDDTLAALQLLAAAIRRSFRGRVVAITGSNGKTTVKEMLRAALGESLRVYASPLSWNSQVGVAMTLLQLDPNADVALIECGISEPGEMARLAAMVQPDLGLFINVGDAHRASLGDAETTAKEKALLFAGRGLCRVFVPAVETLAHEALRAVGAAPQRVGESAGVEHSLSWSKDRRSLAYRGQALLMPEIPEGLRTDLELSAIFALAIGAPAESVERGLARWTPAPMRLEMTMTSQGVFVLNDAYSADPESFDVALRSLHAVSREGRAFAVIGPLAQLGLARPAAHARVGAAVADGDLHRLILVGADATDIGEAAVKAGLKPERVVQVADATEAALILETLVRPGDRVLIKASRPERLERVVELLFSAFGPTVAHIDLEALSQNLDTLRARVGADVAVMPVVKSFGYGLDSVRLGRLFVQHGAEALAVAYADEGVLLRDRGLAVPIVVLNALPHELEKIVTHGLSSETVDSKAVDALAKVAERLQRKAHVHIKVDTGMGRSGLAPNDALDTVRRALASPWIEIEGLMTHLASADEDDAEAFTRTQLKRFDAFVEQARALGARPRWVHAANTAGAIRFPEARYDLVRSGIGLLGYAELSGDNPFLPVLGLRSRVVSVKTMQPGDTVGYGATWVVPEGEPRQIAVVAIGYNDGYPRHLSNKGWMSVRGVRCPVVGRVCMDVTMIDVTAVQGSLEAGEPVVVYGEGPNEPSLREMAELAGTISYELLTRISPRVRRIFVGEISGQTAAG